MNFKKLFINSIEKTGDPTAPIKLQDAYSSVNALGQMLAGTASPDLVKSLAIRLTKDFTENELNEFAKTPDFTMALCSMLNEAIITYTSNPK